MVGVSDIVAVIRCSAKDVEYWRLEIVLLALAVFLLEPGSLEQVCLDREEAAKHGLPLLTNGRSVSKAASFLVASIVKVEELDELLKIRPTLKSYATEFDPLAS